MKKLSFVALAVFLLDRVTKLLITNFFELNVRNKIIDKVFYITNCQNEGAAFSILSGNIIFLVLITILVICLLYIKLEKNKNISTIMSLAYGLLIGGIFGNLLDRVLYGYVIDFIDVIVFNYDFPIFNFADMAIVVGAFLLLVFEGSDKNERNQIDSE